MKINKIYPAVSTCFVAVWLAANLSAASETNGALTVAELAGQIDAHISQPKFSGAIWSIKIVSLDTSRTLYENHSDRRMSPASNSKLYTGALGLDRFGGDHQIATPIFATAPVNAAGVLHGDLIISGRGDPSWNARRLGTNFWDIFEPFAAALTNAGVHKITGNLVADATFFRGQPTGSSWTIDDFRDGDAAEICPLTLNDNLTQVRVEPRAAVGQPCDLTPLHPGTGIIFSNLTTTVASNLPAHLETFHPLDGKIIFILGQLPVGGASEILDVVVPEPADWFVAALKISLARHGITVAGRTRSISWPQTPPWNPAALVKIGEVLSPPLRDIVRGFMKPSQNLETDLLLADVGELTRSSNAPAWLTSEDAGLAALDDFLATVGAPTNDVQFDEGSGLSRNNLTTANATVALLQFMAKHREAAAFVDSLPIAGVDGSLRNRLKATVAAGNVRAKTGTLRWAHALSGYVTTAAGEHLAFSIMLNRFLPAPGRSGHNEIDPIVLQMANFKKFSSDSP